MKTTFILILIFISFLTYSQGEKANEIPSLEIKFDPLSFSVFDKKTNLFSDSQDTNNSFKLWVDPKRKTIYCYERSEKGKKIRKQKFKIETVYQDHIFYEFYTSENGVTVKVVIWKNGLMLAIERAGTSYVYSNVEQ